MVRRFTNYQIGARMGNRMKRYTPEAKVLEFSAQIEDQLLDFFSRGLVENYIFQGNGSYITTDVFGLL